MFVKLRKHRTYQYTPRFYDPQKERSQGRRPIHFRRSIGTPKTRSVIMLFAVMAIIIYFLHLLSQLAK